MKRREMIPYSEDVYGFTYGGAKIERLASNEKTGLVVLWVKTRKGSIKIEVTKAGFISVDAIRVVPPKRSGKKNNPKGREESVNCYILEGHEPKKCADIEKWGMWFATADRKVAVERVGKSEVSTVFLGKDHSFGCGDPVLFETMVFEGPLAGEQERYSTWDEAEVGHKRMVERAKAEEEA